MRRHRHHAIARGFTLIELLVVVAIILIIAGVVVPLLRDKADRYTPHLEDTSATY